MAAPEGNTFAVGYGRPPIYEDTPESIKKVSELVDEYFVWIQGEYEEREGQEVIKDPESGKEEIRVYTYQHCIRQPEPPTVTGLTLFLGFADKSTLYDYSKKESFSHSIKRGLIKIEQHHEIKTSYGDKCTGNIFILKNFGWKDRIEVDQNINDQRTEIDYSKASEEELLKYASDTEEDKDN